MLEAVSIKDTCTKVRFIFGCFKEIKRKSRTNAVITNACWRVRRTPVHLRLMCLFTNDTRSRETPCQWEEISQYHILYLVMKQDMTVILVMSLLSLQSVSILTVVKFPLTQVFLKKERGVSGNYFFHLEC